MIKTETVTINDSRFIYTYSDSGYYIAREDVEYESAYDPVDSGREYTETDHKIGPEDEDTYLNELIAEVRA